MSNTHDLVLEIARQQQTIAELQAKASKYELYEQTLRDTTHQLDRQFDKFGRIHVYALQALGAVTSENLSGLFCEGIIDIFQLECAALFKINLLDLRLELLASLNLDCPQLLPFTRDWLDSCGLLGANAHKGCVESPVLSPLWRELNLAHAVFMPLCDNDQQIDTLVVGGITQESHDFYEFYPKELTSSFMVYGQLMNGILNNREALAQAQDSALAKNRFLANLSHEIRTPMNAISGMVQLASRTSDLASLKQFFSRIDQSSRHLLGLLNEVLDIAKIDEGKFTLTDELFDLKERVDALAASFQSSAQSKNQSLTVHWHTDNFGPLMGDPIRLGQVLLNLISNAIKFTPEGGQISLRVQQLSQEHDKVLLRFEVTDTGKGVSKEARNRIFTAFEQEDGGIARRYGGTGLGLTISQRIVELMGGTLALDSEEGKGSTFHFTVRFEMASRCALSDSALDKNAPLPDLSALRVLIVDDVEINREIVVALLDGTGIRTEEAEDGKQALDMFTASPAGYYNCILMDMQMPVMDGCTATKAIRAAEHPDSAKLAIIALSANAFADDIKQALSAGMNGYIAKPVDHRVLINNIARLVQNIQS